MKKARKPTSRMDTVTRDLRNELLAREKRGRAKYGQSVSETNMPLEDWLQHAIEEALDFAVYLSRVRLELAKRTAKRKVKR